jgi:lysine 2,3-aminomutase
VVPCLGASARAEGGHALGPAGDWRWQLRHSIDSVEALERVLSLTDEERKGAHAAAAGGLPMAITPYYLGLCDPHDPSCPLRRQVVPHASEARLVPGDMQDPLGEERHEVAPSLIRRYPDRALLLVTDGCASSCRFCTRRRRSGRPDARGALLPLRGAFRYLRAHPEVREVIVSGGDPFTLSTAQLVEVLSSLRSIQSVETIRLATRAPVALPQRVTDELTAALQAYHPLWVMTHFNHPKELAPLALEACRRLVDAGFPVMNQTVLLRGVNDDATTLAELFRGLVRQRVRPYYLFQADPVAGSGHLRTPVGTGLAIMRALQGRLSGIALPKLMIDTPGGLGKVPLCPDYVVAHGPGTTRLRTPDGVEVEYLDP